MLLVQLYNFYLCSHYTLVVGNLYLLIVVLEFSCIFGAPAAGLMVYLCVACSSLCSGTEYPNGSSAGSEKTCDDVLGCQMPRQVHGCYLPTKGISFSNNLICSFFMLNSLEGNDEVMLLNTSFVGFVILSWIIFSSFFSIQFLWVVFVIIIGDATKSDVPAPLATKIYYSQRNQRLRSALSHLYYQASTKDHFGGVVKPQVLHSSAMPSRFSLPKNFSNEQIDDQQEKVCQSLLNIWYIIYSSSGCWGYDGLMNVWH